LIGAAIGGVIGGIDAELKGQRFWDGKGKTSVERYLTGTGSNPEPSEMSLDKVIEHSEVKGQVPSDANNINGPWEDAKLYSHQRGHITGKVNSSQFEGNLTVKVRAYPQKGEVFYINVDGKEVFSTSNLTRSEISLPAGNNIGWGIKGKAISNFTNIGNNVFTDFSATPSSYLVIKGQWRSWAGFLFW